MAKEIERKFLIKGEAWRALAEGTMYRQGYLNSAKERTVRVRTVGDKAFLTIKGITVGATRAEYEYEIPFADCNALLDVYKRQDQRLAAHAQVAGLGIKGVYHPNGKIHVNPLRLLVGPAGRCPVHMAGNVFASVKAAVKFLG